MNIAEFFVNLGIKGSDKTVGALTTVNKSLGSISSMSIEAKAGLLGVFYAMERLMSSSAQAGTSLTNFEKTTGVSTKTLQEYQYAARQVGVSNEAVAASFKSVQAMIAGTQIGEGAAKGMKYISTVIGGFKPELIRDIPYMMQQFQKFAMSKVPPEMKMMMLKSVGLDEGTIAGMMRGVFNAKNFAKAPIYNPNEIGQLDRVNIAWSNLGNTVQMAMGHFTARHGMQLVQDLTKVTTQVERLAEAFVNLANKMGAFETASEAVTGMANTLRLINELIDKFGGGKESKKGDLLYQKGEVVPGFSGSTLGKFVHAVTNMKAPSIPKLAIGLTPVKVATPQTDLSKIAVPNFGTADKIPKGGEGGQKSVHIGSQHFHYQHDGKDHKKASDEHKKVIHDTFRQNPAQAQVN